MSTKKHIFTWSPDEKTDEDEWLLRSEDGRIVGGLSSPHMYGEWWSLTGSGSRGCAQGVEADIEDAAEFFGLEVEFGGFDAPDAEARPVHPREWYQFRQEELGRMKRSRERILGMKRLAQSYPLPEKLRPATVEDLKPGVIVWYVGTWAWPYWRAVGQIADGDACAYYDVDGSSESLNSAFVEEES